MTYVIESGIAPPSVVDVIGVCSPERADVRRLEVGQSFAVPRDRERQLRQASSDESKNGKRFTARLQKDGRIRCWRLE